MSTLYGHVDGIAEAVDAIAERQYNPSVRHISEDDYNWLKAGAEALQEMLVYLRDQDTDQDEPDDSQIASYGKGFMAGHKRAIRLERFAHAVAKAVNEYETNGDKPVEMKSEITTSHPEQVKYPWVFTDCNCHFCEYNNYLNWREGEES